MLGFVALHNTEVLHNESASREQDIRQSATRKLDEKLSDA